jgi:hypothetical protein
MLRALWLRVEFMKERLTPGGDIFSITTEKFFSENGIYFLTKFLSFLCRKGSIELALNHPVSYLGILGAQFFLL